jgi:hypothetical protein
VFELAAEGDASVLDAIATGATSDQARATAWPGVVRRLAAVSRSGGPPLGWTTPAPRTVCPLTASGSIPSSANHALDRVFMAATGCSPPVFILLARWSRKSPGQGDACLVAWL